MNEVNIASERKIPLHWLRGDTSIGLRKLQCRPALLRGRHFGTSTQAHG